MKAEAETILIKKPLLQYRPPLLLTDVHEKINNVTVQLLGMDLADGIEAEDDELLDMEVGEAADSEADSDAEEEDDELLPRVTGGSDDDSDDDLPLGVMVARMVAAQRVLVA